MIPNDVRERVEKLRDLINDYRYHYHVLDESIMSEAAADSLKHELSQLEEKYPEKFSIKHKIFLTWYKLGLIT